MLRLFLEGQKMMAGPYGSDHVASVTAANFNRQMREHAPEAYSAWLRFRAKGRYVRLRRIVPK